MLESRYAVHWSGDLPPDPDREWRNAAEHAAALAAAEQALVELTTDGMVLAVEPGPAPTGTTLSGPGVDIDHGPRLLRALTRKAVQTMAAGAAWIWLEDDGALWPLAEFVRHPLRRQVEMLADALAPLFADHPHVLGIVLTSDTLRLDGPIEPVTERHDRGAGYLRALPDGQVLRSQHPEGVRQEIYGFLLVHHAIRALMHHAAHAVGHDPDRISFTRALRVIRRQTTGQAAFSPPAG